MEQDFVNKEARKIDRLIKYVATRTWIKTGIYFVALLEATVLPVLPELVVAAVLSYRKDISWKLLSVISALGSATGATALYLLGRYLYKAHEIWFDGLFDSSLLAAYTEKLLSHNVFVSMFLAAFTPLPDRIFAFLSGVFLLSFPVVIAAFFLGRLIRVGIVAYFSYHFGDEARIYILRHTRRVTAAVLLLVGLYILARMQGIL
jgi:membrane protein YqaA with SNARE-associated domain